LLLSHTARQPIYKVKSSLFLKLLQNRNLFFQNRNIADIQMIHKALKLNLVTDVQLEHKGERK